MDQKKTVFITGLDGFIAYYVTREALARGYRVVGNILSSHYRYENEFKEEIESGDLKVYLGVDVRDRAGMYKVLERADMGIHLAGLLGTKHVDNAWEFYDINVQGGINVLEVCKEFDLPVVFIGVGNYFETNNYSSSKYTQERECIKYAKYCGVKSNVVRALNAVGARQKVKHTGKILPTFITKALMGEDLSVYGGEKQCSIMDLIYAGDVAKVLLNVLEGTADGSIAPGTNDLQAGTGIEPTVWEIAQKVIDFVKESGVDTQSKVVEVPMRAGETPNSRVVAAKMYPMEYKNIDEVIKEAIEWYKNNTWD